MSRKRRGGSVGRSTPDAKRVCRQSTAEEQYGAEADQTPVLRQERLSPSFPILQSANLQPSPNPQIEERPPNPQIEERLQPLPQPLPPALSYCHSNFKNTCSVGEMTFICNICQAAKFQEESKAICCGNGKYSLDPYPNLPAPIKELFNGDSVDSEHFLKNIRRYNCAFQMTSFGCKEVQTHGWNPNFKIQG